MILRFTAKDAKYLMVATNVETVHKHSSMLPVPAIDEK